MGHLYRVTHRHRRGECSHQGEIVADGPGDAITMRCDFLGIPEDGPYDIEVVAVPDPDGARAARWLQRFGGETR